MTDILLLGVTPVSRRSFLGWTAMSSAALLIAGCQQQPAIYPAEVHVDAGCGCCHAWVDLVRASGRFNVKVIEDAEITAFKDKLGVPQPLRSCHTAQVGRYVIEGHVPIDDILKLLGESPAGVVGIAAPGMPRGSPGMEMPNGAKDAYEVVAFDGRGKSTTFAEH